MMFLKQSGADFRQVHGVREEKALRDKPETAIGL